MSDRRGFVLHLEKAPAPFFKNLPNVGFGGEDIDGHVPTILERRLDDLGIKYYLMALANDRLCTQVREITKKYDATSNTLKLGNDYWDLVLYLNYFLFEARATLDLLAIVLRILYLNKLPFSFNGIEEAGKHSDVFRDDPQFHRCLVVAKNADWMCHLLSNGGKTSLRDRAAHRTAAQVCVAPSEAGELIFTIRAELRGQHPQSGRNGHELVETVTAIRNGIGMLLGGFKENYSQRRIRTLLGIPEEAPGLFEPD